MPPVVSIIIPCYKAQDTIVEAIEGVLDQSMSDWECILVSDDGSSYLQHLEKLGITDPRIVEHPEPSCATGTVAPRNRGFAMARGNFIADLDADDIWKPTRLARLLPLAHQHGCAQDILECFDENGLIGFSGPPDGGESTLSVEDVVAFDFPFHLVVRRDLAGDAWSGYDSWVPDVIRTMRLADITTVRWLREPLLRYRVSAASMSQSLDGSRRIDQAYEEILSGLIEGHGFGLSKTNRKHASHGIARKRELNRRYIQEAEAASMPEPFISWILTRGLSGSRLPAD